jgi:predicted Zn-dependent peptidase
MKSLALALALALPSVAAAAEGPKRPSKPTLSANVPEYSLSTQVFYAPSGLTIMFQEDHSHPIVSIMSIVDHGSGDDPKGKEGTAHFVEHTWFRSTQTVRTGFDEEGNDVTTTLPSIMQTLNDYGTLMNATTRNDWTDYRTVFGAEHLDLFLQLESRRLTSPYVGVKEEFIDTEREVITNEWRRRNEQGYSQLFDFLYEEVYPETHPYHSSSTKETLGRVDLATLQKYFDDYYHPEKTTIAVVGDFDIREAASLIFENFDPQVIDPDLKEEHIFKYPAPGVDNPDISNADDWWYGAWDPEAYARGEEVLYDRFLKPGEDDAEIAKRRRIKPTDPREPVPEGQKKREVAYKKAPIDDRVVIVAWPLPGGFRDDHIQLQMLGGVANMVLQGYFNPRNFRMYQEEWRDSDIAGSQCFVQTEKVHSTLMCLVEMRNNKLDPENIADKIIDQIPQLWNPDLVQIFEQRMFPRTRQSGLVDILNSVDRVAYHFGGRAEDIVTYAHYTNMPAYHSNAMQQTMSLNMFEIAKIANEYLTRDRAVRVVIDPLPPSEIDTTGEGSAYAGSSEGDTVIEANEEFENLTDDDVRAAYVKPDLSNLVETTLDNGLKVVILPHGEAPVAYSALVVHGGNLTGPSDRNSFAWDFTRADAIDPFGLDGMDPLSIAGAYRANQYSESTELTLRHAAGNVDGALYMLREQVETMKPYLAGKKNYVTGYQKSLAARWTSRSPGWLASEMTTKHLYPENPERWLTPYDEAGKIMDWGAGEVSEAMDVLMQPKNATLIITGRVNADEALEHAKTYFGGWEAKVNDDAKLEEYTSIETPAIGEGSSILIFDDPKKTQTQVRGACRLNYTDERRAAVNILNSIFFSEVFTRLRVKEGLAYSPAGYARTSAGNVATLGFSSLAVNDGVGRTLEVMKELVGKGEAGEFDEDLIRIHKLREARTSGLEAQSTDQMGGRLRAYARNGWSPKEMLETGERLAAVSPEQIQELMDGCSGRLMFTLHGPAEVLKPQLDKLGYDFEVVDWKGEGEARFQKYDPKGFKKYLKKKAKREKQKAKEEKDGSASVD